MATVPKKTINGATCTFFSPEWFDPDKNRTTLKGIVGRRILHETNVQVFDAAKVPIDGNIRLVNDGHRGVQRVHGLTIVSRETTDSHVQCPLLE